MTETNLTKHWESLRDHLVDTTDDITEEQLSCAKASFFAGAGILNYLYCNIINSDLPGEEKQEKHNQIIAEIEYEMCISKLN